jgi:thioredoxin-like negative regulator of GroEL
VASVAEDPTEAEFEALLQGHESVLVDFYATWCKPCHSYGPRFLAAARAAELRWPNARIAFATIDVDARPTLRKRYRVWSVPATVLLRRGQSWLGRPKVCARKWGRNLPQTELEARIAALCA